MLYWRVIYLVYDKIILQREVMINGSQSDHQAGHHPK